MGNKTSSRTEQERYARYKANGTYAKNKRKKIERHLKKQPNDESAKLALKNVGTTGRKAPNSSVWSKADKKCVSLLASVGVKL